MKNVLFVCSGNSGRSIMAEAILRKYAPNFRAFSAGSHPTGIVNPLAIEELMRRGYPVDGLKSKSWLRYLDPNAPTMDWLISVCGNVGFERLAHWPGDHATLLWSFRSPGSEQGNDMQVRKAFADVCDEIERAIAVFVKNADHADVERALIS